MTWKVAGTIFRGGTQEARALLDKRVRARRALTGCRVFDPNGQKQETASIALNAEGLIGHVPPGQFDQMLLVFPLDPAVRLTSLNQAMRQRTQSLLFNWPTFRDAFDIDA